jgi:uncharacterized membrane protein YkoI
MRVRARVLGAVAASAAVAMVGIAVVGLPTTGPVPPAAESRVIALTGSDDDRDESDDDRDDESVARTADGLPFELEIDPELDAEFGPRPVNAVRAAEIAVGEFGGRVVAAELDEEGGRPIWEIELAGAAVGEIDVDAIHGRIR